MKNLISQLTQKYNLRVFILFCFFLSGMSALIYEILWMRVIARVIGGAPFAVASILIIFMGAMGIGSYIAGRLGDRFREPALIKYYGILEITIGLYGFITPLLFNVSKGFFAVVYNNLFEFTIIYNMIIFISSFILLSIPVICMGATLPLLCRFYIHNLSHLGEGSGRLYGLNTIGAAAGSVLCGFILISSLGLWGTLTFAVSINLFIGASCLYASFHYKKPKETQLTEKEKKQKSKRSKTIELPENTYNADETKGALVIIFVSGSCAMAYEVFWTRLLGLIIGPTTYSFTIVLVTFIIGLAIGNMVFGRLADNAKNVTALLITTQTAAAFLALFVSHFMGNSQLFFAKLIYSFQDSFALLNILKAVILFLFMALPTFFLGAAFPVVIKIYTRSLSTISSAVGKVYTVNTVGAVLGSFFAGFILIPLMGKENGLGLIAGIQIAVPLLTGIVLIKRRNEPLSQLLMPAATLALGVYLCTVFPHWNRHLLSLGKYHRFEDMAIVEELIQGTGWLKSLFSGSDLMSRHERGELVYYGDGIGGFTTVLKYPGPMGNIEYSMANSGKMDASSKGDMKTQTLLAHFPMLFSANPQRVMVLGLASGITGGEVLHYPIKELDIVEINDRVIEACRFFEPWNNSVLSSPRSNIIMQDGIAHLTLTDKSYDVIISEPSNPWMAGMASLFTKDFFELAKSKLTENGIYVQWFHCYQMDWETFALVGRTFADVFPGGVLVAVEPSGTGRDYLLIGTKTASPIDIERARKNIPHAQKSTNIKLATHDLFYRLIVSEDLPGIFGSGDINTDNLPLLEYQAPKLMYQAQDTRMNLITQLLKKSRISENTRIVIEQVKNSIDSQIDFASYALSIYSPFNNMVDLKKADTRQKQKFISMLETYIKDNIMNFDIIEDNAIKDHLRALQIEAISSKIEQVPSKALSYNYLAKLYLQNQMLDKAIASYRNSINVNPGDAQAHNDLGFLLYQKGNTQEARDHYQKAIEIRPNFLLPMGNMAYLSARQGDMDSAIKYFQETLRIKPDLAESYYNIGYIYYQRKDYVNAAEHLNRALKYQPAMIESLNTLAWIHATSKDKELKDPRRAVELAIKANKLTGNKDPMLLTTLSLSFAAAGMVQQSHEAGRLALVLAEKQGNQEIIQVIHQLLPDLQ